MLGVWFSPLEKWETTLNWERWKLLHWIGIRSIPILGWTDDVLIFLLCPHKGHSSSNIQVAMITIRTQICDYKYCSPIKWTWVSLESWRSWWFQCWSNTCTIWDFKSLEPEVRKCWGKKKRWNHVKGTWE